MAIAPPMPTAPPTTPDGPTVAQMAPGIDWIPPPKRSPAEAPTAALPQQGALPHQSCWGASATQAAPGQEQSQPSTVTWSQLLAEHQAWTKSNEGECWPSGAPVAAQPPPEAATAPLSGGLCTTTTTEPEQHQAPVGAFGVGHCAATVAEVEPQQAPPTSTVSTPPHPPPPLPPLTALVSSASMPPPAACSSRSCAAEAREDGFEQATPWSPCSSRGSPLCPAWEAAGTRAETNDADGTMPFAGEAAPNAGRRQQRRRRSQATRHGGQEGNPACGSTGDHVAPAAETVDEASILNGAKPPAGC